MDFWWIIVIVAILLLLWLVISYNDFISLKNHVDKCFSNVDIVLKKRYDLIPDLIRVVKEYTAYESKTLEEIVNLRSRYYNTQKIEDKVDYSNQMEEEIKKIFVQIENYPDLKSSNQFLQLQQQLAHLEDDISIYRIEYNNSVLSYNNKIRRIPNCIASSMMGFHPRQFFCIPKEEKEKPKIEF